MKRTALIAALVALWAASAEAQEATAAPEAIIVTASRSNTLAEEMPLHSTVVTQEDIRKSPAQTVDQLLRTVPGLNFTGIPVVQSDPTGHQTRMRGRIRDP